MAVDDRRRAYGYAVTSPDADRPYDRTDCPSCGAPLDPLPKAKKRCPSCGEAIYVRSGPDGIRHLLREADLAALEAQWADHYERIAAAEDVETNAMAAEFSRVALAGYAERGVREVELIGAEDPCPACAALMGRRIAIAAAPALPVPGCSFGICRCDWVPVF